MNGAGRAATGERRRFALLVAAYALGVFNDNLFRQTAIFLAVAAGRTELRGVAAALYALPFVALAAPAGWLADRFPKGGVAGAAKAAEIGIVLLGGAGMVTGNWWLILAMMFLMGLQSAVFSPALNGLLPAVFPPAAVVRVNAWMRIAVTAAILAGTLGSGYALSLDLGGAGGGAAAGRWQAAGLLLAVAAAGFLASLPAPRRPAAAPGLRFPWAGPAETWRAVCGLRTDRLLAWVVAADVWIWFAGAVQLLAVVTLGTQELGVGEAMTSNLLFGTLVGTAAGGWLSTRWLAGPGWQHRRLPWVLAAQGALLLAMPAAVQPALPAGWRLGLAAGVLFLLGVGCGLVMIPCESFVQVRPPAAAKGRVLAAANALIFTGILLAGVLVTVADRYTGLPASVQLAVLGAVQFPVLLRLRRRLAAAGGG